MKTAKCLLCLLLALDGSAESSVGTDTVPNSDMAIRYRVSYSSPMFPGDWIGMSRHNEAEDAANAADRYRRMDDVVEVKVEAIDSVTGNPVAVTLVLDHEKVVVPATRFGLPNNNVRNSEPGWRKSTKRFHYGIDFSSKEQNGQIGSLEFTAGVAGTVTVHTESDWNTISVTMKNGNTIQYMHANEVSVKTGQKVTATTKLGKTGDAGSPGSTHLHVQSRDNKGKYIDPDTAIAGLENVPIGPRQSGEAPWVQKKHETEEQVPSPKYSIGLEDDALKRQTPRR